MLTSGLCYDLPLYLYTYMFVYTSSLTILFWVLFNTIVTEFKTLYSFSNLGFNSFFVLTITVLLLSMAGVPPFIGFFSKLFIVILLLTSSFFLLYSLLFVILFLGLYFYVQNIRFLHSTNLRTSNYPFLESERVIPSFHYFTVFFLNFTLLGVVYIDDVLIVFSWILN